MIAAVRTNREHFPLGSVSRTGNRTGYGGNDTYDPRGTGDFGGDPDDIGGDGDVHYDGDAVVVSWTVPAAYEDTVDSATLCYNGNAVAMAETSPGSNVWQGTVPAQSHDTIVRWYIRVVFTPLDADEYTLYEPGDTSAPASSNQYSYVAYTHWSPYPYGLPELWSDCAKGTDRYEFTADENIQPALINLARFTLDYIGERFYHTPKNRQDVPECCLEIPIKWRWSGSAPWPHLVEGGKDTDDYRSPLHNLSDVEGASVLARRSWRGTERNWVSEYDNYVYGEGASWLAPPDQVEIELWSSHDANACSVYWDGADRGLREGDVIERAHIEEIIDAVGYLINYGLWSLVPVTRKVATPNWAIRDGHYCDYAMTEGDTWDCDTESPSVAVTNEFDPYPMSCTQDGALFKNCCDSCDYDAGYGYYVCTPHDAPSDWDDCKNGDLPDAPCQVRSTLTASCMRDGSTCYVEVKYILSCWRNNFSFPTSPYSFLAKWEGEGAWFPPPDDDDPVCLNDCWAHVYGWVAYVCGPEECPGGCDSVHGNDIVKQRISQECPKSSQSTVDTGNSHGNCFGEAWTCGDTMPSEGHEIDFEDVNLVWFKGAGWDLWDNWDDKCDLPCFDSEDYTCSAGSCYTVDSFPEIPGFPGHYDPDGDLFCDWCCETGHDSSEFVCPNSDGWGDWIEKWTEGVCVFDYEVCLDDYVWAAIDLRVDGKAPYYTHDDYGTQTGSDDRYPRLRDYDQSPDSDYEPLYTDCPCDTWTSEWGSGGEWSGSGACI
jgi:hypothetical protein